MTWASVTQTLNLAILRELFFDFEKMEDLRNVLLKMNWIKLNFDSVDSVSHFGNLFSGLGKKAAELRKWISILKY